MGVIISSSSWNNAPEKDKFSELIRANDQVKDLLSGLKKEVTDQWSERDKTWFMFDNYVESLFDNKVLEKGNRDIIENHIKNGNYDAITALLNTWIDNDIGIKAMLENLEAAVGKNISIELNDLELNILKESIQQNNTINNNTSTERPRDFWNDPKDIREEYKSGHEFIDKDPKNRSYQALSPLRWNEDTDINGDEKVTKRELKKSGILDRYRQSDADVRKAVETILNFADGEFKRREIKGIDRQSLGAILGDIIRDYYEQSDKRDAKDFKKYFKDNFLQKGQKEYKKRWAGVNNDIKKILTVLEKWLEEPAIIQALKHLADMWSKAKNINVVWASNDITHLESGAVNSKNVFLFLCDFDSDGTIDSTNITKQKPNHSRRDTW